MIKRILWTIAFIAALAIGPSATLPVAHAATINVPGDYATIQEAIDAANSNDTIVVAPGIYNESIVVNKTLTLLGAQVDVDPRPSAGSTRDPADSGSESIIVNNWTALHISADDVVINGFTFESHIVSSSPNVVEAVDAGFPQILYNVVYNVNPGSASNEGIKVRRSGDSGAVVAYNYVYDIPKPGDAINFDTVNGGFISNNEVRNIGSENAAIYIYSSLNTTIEGNLVDTTTQNDGIKLGNKGGQDAAKSGGSIVGNIVRNTVQDGITVYMSDVLVDRNVVTGSTSENGAIYLAFGISNVTITNNCVHDNALRTHKHGDAAGIMVEGRVNAATVVVQDNSIQDNTPYGVTNKAAATLDAANNWWGAADGPSGEGLGTGDAVSANVDFDPWLTEAPPCGPQPIDNQGPIITDVVASPNPVPVDSLVTLIANVDDTTTGGSNIAAVEYRLSDGSWTPMEAADGSFDEVAEDVTASFSAPAIPGVYDLCLRGTDAAGNVGDAVCIMLVVYDPDGGFVTGGGWIMSPEGAYTADSALSGRATFGFVSRYKRGASVPDGNTQFQFRTGDLNFHSTSYQWLIVNQNDANAQFKGSGTINGAGTYGFMIWATDGNPDTFRIKIWNENDESSVVYDNGSNQAIGGGSIVIHRSK